MRQQRLERRYPLVAYHRFSIPSFVPRVFERMIRIRYLRCIPAWGSLLGTVSSKLSYTGRALDLGRCPSCIFDRSSKLVERSGSRGCNSSFRRTVSQNGTALGTRCTTHRRIALASLSSMSAERNLHLGPRAYSLHHVLALAISLSDCHIMMYPQRAVVATNPRT